MKYKKTENGFYANKVRLLQDKYNEIIIVYRTNTELIFTPNASIFQLFYKKVGKTFGFNPKKHYICNENPSERYSKECPHEGFIKQHNI